MFQAQRRVRNTLPRAKRQLEAVQDGGGDRQALSQGNGFFPPRASSFPSEQGSMMVAKRSCL